MALHGWEVQASCQKKSKTNFLVMPSIRVASSVATFRFLMRRRLFRHILTFSLLGIALVQSARADQGHMENALRVKAIGLVNQAINEVNAGIAVGESHGD
jgi:hypothetical protein